MPHEANSWINALNQLPAEIIGVAMAVFISVLRVVYDKEETRPMRIILESGICGGLSLTVSSAVTAMGLNVNWSIFAGGVIGYLGSATIKALVLKFLHKKVDTDDDDK